MWSHQVVPSQLGPDQSDLTYHVSKLHNCLCHDLLSSGRHNEDLLDISVGPTVVVVWAVMEQSVLLQLTYERLGSRASQVVRIV